MQEREPLRRRGKPGLGTVATGEQGGKRIRRTTPLPHLDQRADDIAHHVVKKAIGLQHDIDRLARERLEKGIAFRCGSWYTLFLHDALPI